MREQRGSRFRGLPQEQTGDLFRHFGIDLEPRLEVSGTEVLDCLPCGGCGWYREIGRREPCSMCGFLRSTEP